MRVLLTGGLGFIGGTLLQRLAAKGHPIDVVDNLSPQVHGARFSFDGVPASVHLSRTDIRAIDELDGLVAAADVIVHLAAETGTAQSMYRIVHYTDVNVTGTARLLEAIARAPKKTRRFVLASSRSVYGEGAYRATDGGDAIVVPDPRRRSALESGAWEHRDDRGRPLMPVATPEDCPLRPGSIYAATKLAQEALAASASEALQMETVILRFQNVFGERQSLRNPYTGIISIFANRARQGKPLPVFEDGLESRDFVHVEDVCDAIELALFCDVARCATYNVGSGIATSVREVADGIARHYPACPGTVVTGEYRIGDIRHCYGDLTQIRRDFGYAPRISFEDGLKRFLAWAETQALAPDRLDRANDELRQRGLMK